MESSYPLREPFAPSVFIVVADRRAYGPGRSRPLVHPGGWPVRSYGVPRYQANKRTEPAAEIWLSACECGGPAPRVHMSDPSHCISLARQRGPAAKVPRLGRMLQLRRDSILVPTDACRWLNDGKNLPPYAWRVITHVSPSARQSKLVLPFSWPIILSITREPKPRREGSFTGGPPTSVQRRMTHPSAACDHLSSI